MFFCVIVVHKDGNFKMDDLMMIMDDLMMIYMMTDGSIDRKVGDIHLSVYFFYLLDGSDIRNGI